MNGVVYFVGPSGSNEKLHKIDPVLFTLGLLVLMGCTENAPNEPAAPELGYTMADSIAADALSNSLGSAFEARDTMALNRITSELLRSPFVRANAGRMISVLEWRSYAAALLSSTEHYPAELDSMLADAKERKDTLMMFAVLNNQATVTMQRERDLAKALGYREKALRLDPRQVLISQAPDLYRQLAQDYDNVKQWDRSVVYSSQLVRHGRSTGDTSLMCIGEIHLAAEFQQLGKTDSMQRHVDEAVRLIARLPRDQRSPGGYALLAGIERQRGHHERAAPLLDSMNVSLDSAHTPRSNCPLCVMEQAWHELHSGQLTQAKAVAETMREDPDFDRSKFTQQCFHQVMDPIEVALGDYHSAYDHRARYVAIRDSMNLTSAATNLERIENNYKEDAERARRRLKEEADARLLQEQRTQRNLLLAAGLVALVFGTISYRQRRRTQKALHRSDELLLNILPAEVAEELKAKGHADARHFDKVTILFTDFKGFTEASEKLSPAELVEELNTCFKAFDGIITARGIEKIKTIGDAYMCAGGLPVPASSTPAGVVQAALEMQAFMIARKKERDALGKPAFEMRVGIHTGPVVAGIVGVKKFAYDIWGDTVNIASRMESSGEVGQVNISESTYELVKNEPGLSFTSRGKVQAKGKGEMEMYFVRHSPG